MGDMRRIALVLTVLAVLGAVVLGVAQSEWIPRGSSASGEVRDWAVYFSPRGGATQAIVDAIGGARQSVRVQAYSFTSKPIAAALLAAHKRGVDVRVILDDSQVGDRYSAADFLANQGIATLIDSAHAIAHNKVMVIDDETVITGSFNFSRAAEERNAENLLVIRDPRLASRYTANWRVHESHSRRRRGRGVGY